MLYAASEAVRDSSMLDMTDIVTWLVTCHSIMSYSTVSNVTSIKFTIWSNTSLRYCNLTRLDMQPQFTWPMCLTFKYFPKFLKIKMSWHFHRKFTKFMVFLPQGASHGYELLAHVFAHLDILETDYFGLQYTDEKSVTRWIDQDKSIKKQTCKQRGSDNLFTIIRWLLRDLKYSIIFSLEFLCLPFPINCADVMYWHVTLGPRHILTRDRQ